MGRFSEEYFYWYQSYLNSGARDDSIWDGNTVLLEIEDRKYIFIGNSGVYSFKTEDKIIKFISNMGGNSVPYAIAYGDENIYYLSDIRPPVGPNLWSDMCVYIPYISKMVI